MRLTFVTPHQRPTSGGVYAIQQYARLLADRHDVTIAVRKGQLRAVPGCSVIPIADAGPADAVIFPADYVFDDLPRGTPVCYLQGFGTPGNPTVVRNLELNHRVIAVAGWLAEEARAHACPTDLVPYGIDRELFRPGVPAQERDQSVLMMTHTVDWKGTDDGLAAIERIRGRIPEVQIVLFGALDFGIEARFVPAPSRRTVSELMRDSAVFICSSWEEGFGLPGLEAMSCGTAVATTDTKGSREYAFQGRSALVVPPRDPDKLAAVAIDLLEDADLRRRIAEGGLTVADGFPDWSTSAKKYEHALLRACEKAG